MSAELTASTKTLARRLRMLADEIESAARYGVPIPFMVSVNGHEHGGASFHLDRPDDFAAWVDYTFGGGEKAVGHDCVHDGQNWSRATVDVNGLPVTFATTHGATEVVA